MTPYSSQNDAIACLCPDPYATPSMV